MARVIITDSLKEQVKKQLKKESATVFRLMEELEDKPKKGKHLGVVGNTVFKELKYNSYRFYFVTDAHKIKFLRVEELTDLLIKFVRMSHKNDQQKTIDEIKFILKNFGKF